LKRAAMIREVAPKYVAVFRVEADSREALEAAVKYVAKHVEDGVAAYACGPYLCTCNVEVEWDGMWLTVRSCKRRTAHIVAKWLLKAYAWYGGKSIRLVKCEEYKP
jgi:hypothetical protein